MSSAKIIENPEIPGLECILPPPPPPPPPVTTSRSNNLPITTEQQQPVATKATTTDLSTSETAGNLTAIQTTAPSFPNITVPTSYIMHPAMQPQTPGQPTTPWWIPTDADTSDLYARWYNTTYKAAATAAVSPTIQVSNKAKNKYYKRKNEFIDPAQDAEKVASAQRELAALMKPLKCDLCNAVVRLDYFIR